MQVALKEHFWNVCRAYEIFGDLCEWSQGLIVIINGEGARLEGIWVKMRYNCTFALDGYH